MSVNIEPSSMSQPSDMALGGVQPPETEFPRQEAASRNLGHRNFASPLYVVGIGASAGGLEALERFFDEVSADCGLAFVVVQHLSPDFKSLMDQLLARRTRLPIHRAEEGMRVEPNAIYLNPPKKDLLISDGRLRLVEKDTTQQPSLTIDTFFRSLAKDAGTLAIGIVLSGTGSDGSRGIQAIREAGGLVLVQQEDSAKFDGMPHSAIETGAVDYVLPPDAMPGVLLDYVSDPFSNDPESPSTQETRVEATHRAEVVSLLREKSGIDFSIYKPTMVARRIARRIAISQCPSYEEYLQRVRSVPGEIDSLYMDLLVGVTKFFRDPAAFERLERDILPPLLAAATGGPDGLRIWVAGCSTGEEAYSIAIILQELTRTIPDPPKIKIFATDVHRDLPEVASTGVYSEQSVANVAPARLERYFTRHGQAYQVSKELRQMIVFAQHNLVKDAPFTKIDLVTCRNLLIYLQPAAQKKALSLFHFSLTPNGVLFLGPSESINPVADAFETLDEHWKLYRKRSDVRLPVETRLEPPAGVKAQPNALQAVVRKSPTALDPKLLRAYDSLLEETIPPSILVGENGELLHCFGVARQYLHPPLGRPSSDILDMVDDDFRIVLGAAIQQARSKRTAVVFDGVRVVTEDGEQRLKLVVKPIPDRKTNGLYLQLLLERSHEVSLSPEAENSLILDAPSRQRIDALETELRLNRENLQATIEELETSNEELQATNEELVASTEELQSTNEELQSVNEELYTVNSEYQRKIEELTVLNTDMDNLLRSTEIGTVFLDRDLRIRKFTPSISHTFNLVPTDVGRPIGHFTNSFDYPSLPEDLAQVLRDDASLEREVRTHGNKPLLMRIQPYRRADGRVDGVVLTFVDTSTIKEAEADRAASYRKRQALVAALGEIVYERSLPDGHMRWSGALERLIGSPSETIDGDSGRWLERVHPDDRSALQTVLTQAPLDRQTYDLEYRVLQSDGDYLWVSDRGAVCCGPDGQPRDVVGVIKDISHRKSVEEVRQNEWRQFLAILDNFPEILYVVDPKTHEILFANRVVQELLGRNPVGGICFKEFHDIDVPCSFCMDGNLMRDHATHSWEADKFSPGRHYLLKDQLIRWPDGRDVRFEVAVDITARKEAELALRKSKDELAQHADELSQSNEDLELFAYLASHDLKEPLRMVSSYTRLLAEEYTAQLDDEAKKYIHYAADGATRMQTLIDDLLAFCRVGKTDDPFRSVDLTEVFQSALGNLEAAIQESNSRIETSALPTVCGHFATLVELFQNLLANAIKFRGPTNPVVQVSCSDVGSDFQITVRDNGIGIDPSYHEQIFRVFQRLHSREEYSGTGIGLAICKRIAEHHGGRLWVESVLGRGAAFHVTFPKDLSVIVKEAGPIQA